MPDHIHILIGFKPDEALSELVKEIKRCTTNFINEKNLIIETLNKVKHNKSKAAKMLNIDRKTLYSKMEKYSID